MNTETSKIVHELKKELDRLGTCLECVIFDLKDTKKASLDDIDEMDECLKIFESHLISLRKGIE